MGQAPIGTTDQYVEGSPIDRNVFMGLLFLGLIVLSKRGRKVGLILRANVPMLLFSLYCAISILWSDYPDVAFKRWIKALGVFVMVMIVLTDSDPAAATKRLLARLGFLYIPISVLFIKYYPAISRVYSRWEGELSYTGVADDKNMLGMGCLVFGIGAAWRVAGAFSSGQKTRWKGSAIAHGCIFVMALWLLWKSNSMTSLSCFIMACGVIVAMKIPVFRRSPMIHVLVASVTVFSVCVLFLNVGGILAALGRNPTLTGRTELWNRIIGMADNPLLGAGFESFWLGERLAKLWSIYWWHPNESHNGYLELFLNLGWLGVAVFAVILVTGYRNIMGMLRYDPEEAKIRLAYFVIWIVYNFTEAAFKTMHPVWIFFLFACIAVPKPRVAHTVLPYARPSETLLRSRSEVQTFGVPAG
jgi:O-antigen ligase